MDWPAQYQMFMPHGMCLLWRPGLMALHISSDALIAGAYFTIPVAIWRFVRGRDDLQARHRALAGLFGAFIAFCGLTHLLSIVVLWIPVYVIEGWLKGATAIVSIATAAMMIVLVPQVLRLPSIRTLQREVDAHRRTLADLSAARAALAARVDRAEGELRQSTAAEHRSSALLATVIEAVPGLIYAKDREGRMLLANKATLELLGRDWPDVEGRTDREVLPDQRQAELVMSNDRRVMEAGTVQELEEVIDFPGRGARVWLSTKVPFGHTRLGAVGLVGVSIDITDRKRLERQVVAVSRRSAMGELGTAIAHEINQPLNAISLYIGGCLTLLEKREAVDTIAPTLRLANEQCVRAGEIVRRLRAFVSGEQAPRRTAGLRLIIDQACSLALLGTREQGVVTVIEEGVADIAVTVDPIQIEQVVVNLVRNALDALAGVADPTLHIHLGRAPNNMAVVSISDNGPGIRPDMVDHLFEPFISTKGGEGLGVGLSICRTIIEAHGGRIWVEPGTRPGASFRFTLAMAGPSAANDADTDPGLRAMT